MTKAKYQTPEYLAAYKGLRAAQRRGEILWCVEKVCKMESRAIYPTDKAHVAHDPTGQFILGASHESCNTSEGATRGNRMRRNARNWEL